MAVPIKPDCTDTIAVRNAVCNNAQDIQEMIALTDDGTLTTNYSAKPIALLVKEKLDNDLQALGITYVWADVTARNAQTGMVLDEQGYQSDTKEVYKYDGSTWNLFYSLSQTEYLTSVFKLVDDASGFKESFDLTALTANRTLNMPDTNVSLKGQNVVIDMTADANQTLTPAQIANKRIEITDISVPITAQRTITLDNLEHSFLFVNNADFALNVIALGGTGIVVAAGQSKELRNNTVNIIEFEAISEITGVLSTDDFLHIQDQKTTGTDAGASVAGEQVRVLNTILTNTITGSSLASNQITLPSGDYYIEFSIPQSESLFGQAWIRNVTDVSIEILGQSLYANGVMTVLSQGSGLITLSGTKVLEIKHYTQSVYAYGLGRASGSGNTEVYSDIKIWKVG